MLPQEIFWILTPQSPLSWVSVSHSDRIRTDYPNHYPEFNLESLKFFTKNIFIMKNLTDFRKTVETGMHPRLLLWCEFPKKTHLPSIAQVKNRIH